MKKTRLPKGARGVYFQTRHLDETLARRLRVYAAERHISLEQALNEVLAFAFERMGGRHRGDGGGNGRSNKR